MELRLNKELFEYYKSKGSSKGMAVATYIKRVLEEVKNEDLESRKDKKENGNRVYKNI